MQRCKLDGVPLIKGEERHIFFVFIFVSDIPALFFKAGVLTAFPLRKRNAE